MDKHVTCRSCGSEISPIESDRHCGRIALCQGPACGLEVDSRNGLPVLLCGDCDRCKAVKNIGLFNHMQRARNEARKTAKA